SWQIVDLLGRQITDTGSQSFSPGRHDISLQIPGPTGTYFLLITNPDGVVSRHKLVMVK
ncbi:T9SS type A sorting domain-containing protein, partial [bacterium]|nr:T9SS type A sorting domain-containing protein [bacterium]